MDGRQAEAAAHSSGVAGPCTEGVVPYAYLDASYGSSGTREVVPSCQDHTDGLASYAEDGLPGVSVGGAYAREVAGEVVKLSFSFLSQSRYRQL